ncbi:MAG TPA: kelch repeat-containing protein, partial [Chloroflexia bacterium]|nr:kelch repeat-containing protein [Chloroflexia bacterium]
MRNIRWLFAIPFSLGLAVLLAALFLSGAPASAMQVGQTGDKQAGAHGGQTALSNAALPREAGSSQPKAPSAFVNKAAIPVPVDRHAAVTTANYLFALGGEYYTGSYAVTSTVQRYDSALDSWSFVAPMPGPLDNHEACAMNGKIYVPGGYTGAAGSTAFYIYDIAAGTWTTGPSVPGNAVLWAVVACDAAANKLYKVGGYDFTTLTATNVNSIYDVATSTWSTGTALPTARYGADGGLIAGNIYAAGGALASGVGTTLVERYNIAGNSWTTVAPMAVGGLYGSAGVSAAGQLYITGGGFGTDANAFLTRTERYDPAANTWTTVDPLLQAVRHTNGGMIAGTLLHSVAGFNNAAGCPTGGICGNNQQLAIPAQGTPTTTPVPSTATRTVAPPTATVTVAGGTATPTGCALNYTYTVSTGTIVPGTTDIGNHTDDGATFIALPFSYTLYDQAFAGVNAGSNGHLTFGTINNAFNPTCIPVAGATYAIGPYWTDQCTGACFNVTCTGCGIFTSVSGVAPNRIFNIEYRTAYYNSGGNGVPLNYEVRLYEGQTYYDVIYGNIPATFTPPAARNLSVGVQRTNTSQWTLEGCDPTGGAAPPVSTGQLYRYTLTTACTTPTTTAVAGTATRTPAPPTSTATRTSTAAASPTGGGPAGMRILLVYADSSGPPAALQSALLAQPGVIAVDLFDAVAGTPTLAQLLPYTVVAPMSNSPFLDGVVLGNNLADYVDAGGVVVQLGFSHYGPNQPYGVNGRWITGNYNPYTYSATIGNTAFTLGTFNAAHPLMQGVTALNSNFQNVVTLAAGATQVAAASNGNSLIAYRPVGTHTTVGITAYIGVAAVQSGDWARVIVNAGNWLRPAVPCGTATVTPVVPTATRTATAASGTTTPTACVAGGTPGPWVVRSPAPTDFYGGMGDGDGANAYFA